MSITGICKRCSEEKLTLNACKVCKDCMKIAREHARSDPNRIRKPRRTKHGDNKVNTIQKAGPLLQNLMVKYPNILEALEMVAFKQFRTPEEQVICLLDTGLREWVTGVGKD